MKFVCDMCGQGFPFISILKQHKITNRTIATLPCMRKGCDRIFNNLGDLHRHVGQYEATEFQFVVFFLALYFIICATKINTSRDDNHDFVLGYQQATGNFASW